MINICHSLITSYPPNPILYPNFYKCKELTFILNPGDMIFIPKGWFHWVFSYPDNSENIAISYAILEDNNHINGDFKNLKPFITKLSIDEQPLKDYSFDSFVKLYPMDKLEVFKSKKDIIIPVHKKKSSCIKDVLTFKEMKSQNRQFNLYVGQNDTLKCPSIPNIISNNFPNSTMKYFYWISLFKKTANYIDSGLHYDNYHSLLTQVKGKKLVKLYAPHNIHNLYCSNFMQI